MGINFLTITVVSDNIFLMDMFGNYLFKNNSYCVYQRTFKDSLPDTDVYIIISDIPEKIEKIISSLLKKYIIVISHRNDKFFYERLFSFKVNCLYDYSSELKLFDDIGLQLSIYYNGLNDEELKEIINNVITTCTSLVN